jgi:phospholipid/cholesterol/gamma-HCH transport system substrate-binding protein
VSSIDPEAAGGLIHELSLALDGRGESLRTLTLSMDELTASFVERTDQLDRLAENSTRITSVLADHRLSLGRSISNLRAVAEALQAADGDTKVLLDLGPDFIGTTADLVADQKQNLDCLLTDLAPVLRTLAEPAQLDSLAGTLERSPLAFGLVAAALDHEADGAWARVNLLATVEGEQPAVYVPPRGLPVVPSVPACASTLSPVSDTPYASGSDDAAPAAPGDGDDEAGAAAAPEEGDEGDAGALDGIGSVLDDAGGWPVLLLLLLLLAGGVGWQVWRRRGGGAPRPSR